MTRLITSRRNVLLGMSALGLGACGFPGPTRADRVYIEKANRRLFLLLDNEPIAQYSIDLGFAPVGDKVQEGDGRTPEGEYYIDRRNPNSLFHLSVGINYPNEEDIAQAEALGVDPGSDIFIHGGPRPGIDPIKPDWTAGCVSVTDREIEQIYARVPNGTPVTIRA